MQLPKFSFNIQKSVVISAGIHVALFLIAVTIGSVPTSVPVPVGVELKYGDGGDVAAAKEKTVVQPAKVKPAVVADASDAPAVKNEKVEKVAAQEVTPAGKTSGSLAGTSDKGASEGREGVANGSEVSPEQRYLYEVRKLLERRKRYPMMAKKMGQVGRVLVRFTLAQDGSLQASEIIEKAEHEALNKAAHELVQGIDKMKPFPEEIPKTSWVITVPIEYSLN
ncbi:MAG: energy transducer TonB [Bdellovibrio sp.]|nr:energy transducer TonB [Bdellovibrio sp.]